MRWRRSSSAAPEQTENEGIPSLGRVEVEAIFELLPLVLDHLAERKDPVFTNTKANPSMQKQVCRGLLGAAAMRGGLNDDGPAHDLLVSIELGVGIDHHLSLQRKGPMDTCSTLLTSRARCAHCRHR